jgi:hypothetical protein
MPQAFSPPRFPPPFIHYSSPAETTGDMIKRAMQNAAENID